MARKTPTKKHRDQTQFKEDWGVLAHEFAKQEGLQVHLPSSYKKKGFDAGKVKALDPKAEKIVYLPMLVEQGNPKLLGKHLKLNEKLRHRVMLSGAMTQFLTEIQSKKQ